MSAHSALPIAVIGAGFSGTMAAIQLLDSLPSDRPVLLCERSASFGRGLAYGTDDFGHFLNLRASNMSAFPDCPRHFEQWLAHNAADLPPDEAPGIRVTPVGTFASRALYGRYLSEILTEAVTGSNLPRLRLVNDGISDLMPGPGGFAVRTEGGLSLPVAGAVLAMGNLAGAGEPYSRHRADLWSPETIGRLQPELPVLIVGTGLSMIDAVISLRRSGFSGPIVALSRRGLLPNAHAPTEALPVPNLTAADLRSLTTLTRRIRAMAVAADGDWRSVIDALRPIVDFIWRSLPAPERGRFLRHLRPFWDVHRHRSAPPAASTIEDDIAAGSLIVRAGRILSIEDEPSRAVVTLRPRGAIEPERLTVQCILDATGIGRVSETSDPLLRRLIGRGLVRPGPFGLGLDVDSDFRARGLPLGGPLWTIGPLMRGALWECIAVPDIRNQAADLAAGIAAELARAEAA
ncbi:pyridine nucleotide-disulfide oxidoreductase [Methylobacterium sp. C25]|uniref:FAD/NAD(P)-binding protein n=1 Tax=Methylobacterium sp. C25 TaxID=2721622 RepID=UPI001F217983|nr:FAD/NAD(P)-binding protein [Methylobacterium sp. C25]MCE4223269.1 pyridine nucleotide-disulfide oxidoreductase [Methylobacterium sp. C25]